MRKGWLFTVAALAALAPPAAAQDTGPKALNITATNVTAVGSDRAAESDVILPGDVIEYALAFTNPRDIPIQDVVFTNPVPSGLVIVLGSAGADRDDVVVDYSIDDAGSWSEAPTVPEMVDGQIVERPAPATTYTHVRWTITDPIAPGVTVTARFRASAVGLSGGER